eukprot:TRINITY_DN21018_c0_g1_i2.p1 TRINITY_DN21018_c0_g1~~TRINITY_DN21018_c0_g1_i2.p1  ORF type:complete len:153 (+),score=43.00 TRINITY_DN21018_c0_g1_i2:885-1343(+)
MPSLLETLGEFRRACGQCFLPSVQAQWNYVMNAGKGGGDLDEVSYFAELLRQNKAGASVDDAEPIERVMLPPKLGSDAHRALVLEELEVLLLRWSVAGTEFVPVRLAIYDDASEQTESRFGSGTVTARIVDAVPFASHLIFASPPPTAQCCL